MCGSKDWYERMIHGLTERNFPKLFADGLAIKKTS
jgi:hypothetical protein